MQLRGFFFGVLLLFPLTIFAQTVIFEGNTASGIRNLDVNGTAYDVDFQYGSANNIYGIPPVFDFNTDDDARDATLAVVAALNGEPAVQNVGPIKDANFKIGHDTEEILGTIITVTEEARYRDSNWDHGGPDFPDSDRQETYATFTIAGTAEPDVPNAPTGISAAGGNAEATVYFSAPADDGGSTITSYTATSSPGGITASAASSPITVTGLTNGTAYTFTVHATNTKGDGPESVASNSVTPRAAPPGGGEDGDISPMVGQWDIDEESNGKPGRGFQIDVQNDVIVLAFYGYEVSGSSTFYIAAGAFAQGSNEVTMPLNQFENGTAFGQPFQDAVLIGSAGNVTFRLFEMDRGEICLPGESCKAVSATNFAFPLVEELLGDWVLVTNGFDTNVWLLEFKQVTGNRVAGKATIKDGFSFSVDLFCELDDSPESYTYSCGVEEFGEVERFRLNVSRNGIVGETDESEELLGWRLRNKSGRMVFPN